jgi:hypothetical protein
LQRTWKTCPQWKSKVGDKKCSAAPPPAINDKTSDTDASSSNEQRTAFVPSEVSDRSLARLLMMPTSTAAVARSAAVNDFSKTLDLGPTDPSLKAKLDNLSFVKNRPRGRRRVIGTVSRPDGAMIGSS